jgi:hypothetical protein
MKMRDSRRPSHRASFPSLGDTRRCARRFAPCGPGRTTAGLGFAIRSPTPEYDAWRRSGPPKFLENPYVPTPCSQTPARPTLPRQGQIAADRHGPTHSVPRGLSTRGNFGARSHGIGTRCLRFAVRLTPPHARLASGCGPSSTRRDWLPAGFLRKVSVMQLTSLPPFPSFLAQTLTPCMLHFKPSAIMVAAS